MNTLEVESFVTKLELSAEKIKVLIDDIATEYFDINDEDIRKHSFIRTRIKADIISEYLAKFLQELQEYDNLSK